MSNANWPARRFGALGLTLGLVAILAYSLSQGSLGTLPVLASGIVLGALYVWRGGSLPEWADRFGNRRGGASITRDDDPGNIPPKVYLPILLGVLLLAALIFAVFMKR